MIGFYCSVIVLTLLSFDSIRAQTPLIYSTETYNNRNYDLQNNQYVQNSDQSRTMRFGNIQRPTNQQTLQTLQNNVVTNHAPSPRPPPPSQGQLKFQYDDASFAITELARKIGRVLGQQTNAGIFSPVSIACALSLLLLGSSGNTKDELSQVMGFDIKRLNEIHHQFGHLLRNVATTEPDKVPITWRRNDRCSEEEDDEDFLDEKAVINLANAMFVRQELPIKSKFINLSTSIYNSTVRHLDFAENSQQAAFEINQWASLNTYGKINQIVSSYLNPDTQMIVANALYFKGLWKNTFEKQATAPKKFFPDGYNNPSTAKEVLSMVSIGCYPYYDGSEEFNAKIIGLPYQGDKTALYIIVPNNSSRAVMQKFQQNLNAAHIGTMVQRMVVKKALIQMPKMKISSTLNLRDILQQLNLRSIFSPGTSDLSQMLAPVQSSNRQKQQRLYASEIIHKVELEINEKGTEGGAVTASTIFRSLPSVQMRIDTPFLMLLGHDETRLPLFYGSVYDPTG